MAVALKTVIECLLAKVAYDQANRAQKHPGARFRCWNEVFVELQCWLTSAQRAYQSGPEEFQRVGVRCLIGLLATDAREAPRGTSPSARRSQKEANRFPDDDEWLLPGKRGWLIPLKELPSGSIRIDYERLQERAQRLPHAQDGCDPGREGQGSPSPLGPNV
jgi:hypothetical protein